MRVRAFGRVLVGLAALFGAQAIGFVPEASACLPGFKPRPGVTNPTDNARDCEPEGAPASPPPPPGGAAAPPEPGPPPERGRPKKPAIVSPSEQRRKVEDQLRGRSKGDDGQRPAEPPARPPGPASGPDDAIKRVGQKLKEDKGPVLTLDEIEQLMINQVVERIVAMVSLVQTFEAMGAVCRDPGCPVRQQKLDAAIRHYFDGEESRYGDYLDEVGGPFGAGFVEAFRNMAEGRLPAPTPAPAPAPAPAPPAPTPATPAPTK